MQDRLPIHAYRLAYPDSPHAPGETWQAWMDAYRAIVRDMQDIYEEDHGRRPSNRRHARQEGS